MLLSSKLLEESEKCLISILSEAFVGTDEVGEESGVGAAEDKEPSAAGADDGALEEVRRPRSASLSH